MCKPEATKTATLGLANDTNQQVSLEELVRADPPAPFFQAASTAFGFVWKTKVCKKLSPGGWLALYGGMTGVWMGLPTDQRLLRRLVGIAGSLPLLGFVGVGILSTLFVRNKRQPASESAQAILLERLEKGRARRIPDAYDVYLPPPPDKDAPKTKQVGMLYFPGALINHTAYASVAAALSDHGILVVVVSLEPVRFIADVATNRTLALRALRDLEAHHPDIAVDEWVLAGHSAGAMTALNLAAAADNASVHSSIRKLVVCGVGRNETGEGQTSLRNKSLSVLVVNGSEDGLLKFVKPDEREAFDRFLPPADTDTTSKSGEDPTVGSTHSVIIPGGNHGGFADYPPSPIDGERTISLQDQQRIFVERTADFLVGSK